MTEFTEFPIFLGTFAHLKATPSPSICQGNEPKDKASDTSIHPIYTQISSLKSTELRVAL